jgi:hypothetical protein
MEFPAIGSDLFLASSPIAGSPISITGTILNQSLASLSLRATSALLVTWTIDGDSIEVYAGPGSGPLPPFGTAFGFRPPLRSRLRRGRAERRGLRPHGRFRGGACALRLARRSVAAARVGRSPLGSSTAYPGQGGLG